MILKIKKRVNPFAMIDKSVLRDKRLSYRARGILGYLLTKTDDWNTKLHDLRENGTEGREAIRTAIKELEKFGYARLVSMINKSGNFCGTTWEITEQPETAPPGNPSAGLLVADLNTDSPKTRITRKVKGPLLHKGCKIAIPYPNTFDEMIDELDISKVSYDTDVAEGFFVDMQKSDWIANGKQVYNWINTLIGRMDHFEQCHATLNR